MKIGATNKKVREILGLVREGKLIPQPEFQRRLVWSQKDKNYFLDTVLRGYPFPEIYLADGDVDLETGEGTQLLVDGLQRVNTLIQYFNGDPDLKLLTVSSYSDLSGEDKEAFLHYSVAVRDLGSVTRDELVEVFTRINATNYSLFDIEVTRQLHKSGLMIAVKPRRCRDFGPFPPGFWNSLQVNSRSFSKSVIKCAFYT